MNIRFTSACKPGLKLQMLLALTLTFTNTETWVSTQNALFTLFATGHRNAENLCIITTDAPRARLPQLPHVRKHIPRTTRFTDKFGDLKWFVETFCDFSLHFA